MSFSLMGHYRVVHLSFRSGTFFGHHLDEVRGKFLLCLVTDDCRMIQCTVMVLWFGKSETSQNPSLVKNHLIFNQSCSKRTTEQHTHYFESHAVRFKVKTSKGILSNAWVHIFHRTRVCPECLSGVFFIWILILFQVTETRTGPLGCSSYDNLDSVSSILLQSPESKLHLQGKQVKNFLRILPNQQSNPISVPKMKVIAIHDMIFDIKGNRLCLY